MSKKLTKEAKSVVHHTPGRTRLKVPKDHRHKLHQLKEHLAKTPGVKSVEVNKQTGSILVHHDQDAPIFEILHKTAESVGTELLTTLIEGGSVEAMMGPVGWVSAGVGVVVMVGKSLLSSVAPEGGGGGKPLLTGTATDLKTLVPTAFFLAAAYKVYETRSFWHGITPLALLYWGFDTYWRFNIAQPSVFEQHGGNGHEKVEDGPRHHHG
jgi:hypothetical protein